jgi:hypothetical protein
MHRSGPEQAVFQKKEPTESEQAQPDARAFSEPNAKPCSGDDCRVNIRELGLVERFF